MKNFITRLLPASSASQTAIDDEPAQAKKAKPLDVAIIGDGFSAASTAVSIAEARKLIGKKERASFDIQIIGRKDKGEEKTSGGRAYTKGVGYAQSKKHKVNLPALLMEVYRDRVPTIDPNLAFVAGEPPSTSRGGTFADDYNLEAYALRKRLRNPFKYHGTNRNNIPRELYGQYLASSVDKAISKSKRVNLDAVKEEVTDVDYNRATKTFTIKTRDADNGQMERTREARNVVLATGHQSDAIPRVFTDNEIDTKEGFHSGTGIFSFLNGIRKEFKDDPATAARNYRDKSVLVVGTGLTALDAAITLKDLKIDKHALTSRNGHTHNLPQSVPVVREIRGSCARIGEALNVDAILQAANNAAAAEPNGDFVNLFSSRLERAFKTAKDIAEGYATTGAITVRGHQYDRQTVCRALLSQYVVYKYEQIRAGLRAHPGLPEQTKHAIVARIFDDIEMPNSGWITTSRTPTTDQNLRMTEELREKNKLFTSTIEKAEKLDNGKFRVWFSLQRGDGFLNQLNQLRQAFPDVGVNLDGPYCDVDIILNCTGRSEEITAPLETNLLEKGLLSRHPTGHGVAVDADGKAIPAQDSAFAAEESSPPLYVVSPPLLGGDIQYPANDQHPPLSTAIGESVLSLRLKSITAGKAITENVRKDKREDGN